MAARCGERYGAITDYVVRSDVQEVGNERVWETQYETVDEHGADKGGAKSLVGENNAPTVKSWDSHPLGETYQVNELSENVGNLLIAGKH